MTPLEIVISCLLLILMPTIGIKIGKQIANRFSFGIDKRSKIMQDIQDALQSGVDTLNSTSLSPQELKKLKIKKEKFLNKVLELVSEISAASGIKLAPLQCVDRLLSESVTINIISMDDIKNTNYYGDYVFAHTIIKELAEDTKFPKKEDYLQLNTLYKKYKNLNKHSHKINTTNA